MANKVPASAFKRDSNYVRKFEEWLKSPAYRNLCCGARCLLEEFQRLYRRNRPEITISVANAAGLLNVSENTARRYFWNLQSHGFIALCEEANHAVGLARTFRLTIEPYHGSEPTDDWKDWRPDRPLNGPNISG